MYKVIAIDSDEKSELRRRLEAMDEVMSMACDPKYFARLVALGIQQEVGTIHDELSRFTYDAETRERVPFENLRAELIEYNGYVGVKITQFNESRIRIKIPGIRLLTHPKFSGENDGSYQGLYFFPEIITRIAQAEGAKLVVVKPWALNTIFGGFDLRKPYYEGNIWEFVNLDSVRYAQLLTRREIAFLGTHDLVSHISGLQASNWSTITANALRVQTILKNYFDETQNLVPHALVIPHVIGLLLDDLAQPMNFGSENRQKALDLLLREVETRSVSTKSNRLLLKYPERVKDLIELARSKDNGHDLQTVVQNLVKEMELTSVSVRKDVG